MTTPGSENTGFEYTDDSVIARVAFDIPNQGIGDIKQLSDAMDGLQTRLIEISRAQGDWVDYIKQIPTITEAANDALEAHITRLERISYLQSQTPSVGGGGAGYGGPGGGGYSTAAPAGYVNPWGAGTPGLGMGGEGGMAGGGGGASEKVRQIAAENPGLMENMESARGGAVNPAILAATTAGITTAIGRGKAIFGAKNPQPGHGERDSATPPDPEDGGAPKSSSNKDTDGEPSEDAPMIQRVESLVNSILNEGESGKNGRLRNIAGAIGGMAARKVFSGAKGTLKDKAMDFIKSPPAMVGGALGLGALGFNAVQNVGEKITEFQQLGSVQGGDWQTGMKYEAQARILALNPFITTQQARQAMQMALKEGFRGDNYDTVQDFMIQNFKELGISMGESMQLMKSQAVGMSEGDDRKAITKDMEQTLNTMKELSAEGGASFPERARQYRDLSEALAGDGVSPESISRAALGLQEGYGDSMALRDSITGIAANANKNTMFNTIVARELGITGMLPGALQPAINQMVDPDEALEIGARVIARQVSGHPNPMNRIANFMAIMNDRYGQNLSWEESEALYNKVTGGESPVTRANNRVARQGKTETGGGSMRAPSPNQTRSSNPADADWNSRHGNYQASENASGVAGSYDGAGRGSANFAPSGNAAPPLPQAGSPIPATLTSSGTVTGNVTITVDQAGRVSAPSVIQLTGTQQAAYAGFSSAQVNNPSPGDPNYRHAFKYFPAPGGG